MYTCMHTQAHCKSTQNTLYTYTCTQCYSCNAGNVIRAHLKQIPQSLQTPYQEGCHVVD